MNIKVDTHTHTIASTHAYSTIQELAYAASKCGLEAIAVTDHGMCLSDAPHAWHFHNLKNIPRELFGVKILYGIEANIIDSEGNIDPLEKSILQKLDIVNASIHAPCYSGSSFEDNTNAYTNIVLNPDIDIICHSGSAAYPYDYEKIILLAKQNNKLIEINNHSFHVRKSSIPNCIEIARLCKRFEVGVVVTSDAHISYDLGNYSLALDMLKDIDFPSELIMNRSFEDLSGFFEKKGKPFFRWSMI